MGMPGARQFSPHRLSQLIAQSGVSKTGLAQMWVGSRDFRPVNNARMAIRAYESGRRTPDEANLRKLARVLRCDVEDLLESADRLHNLPADPIEGSE